MPGFENLPQSLGEGTAYEPIQAKDTAGTGQALADASALKLCVQTALLGKKYVQSRKMDTEWELCDNLFRDYVEQDTWPNSGKKKSAIPIPVIMESVEDLLSQIVMAFFSDPTPFVMTKKGKTSQAATTAMAHLVAWAMERAGFQEEFRKLLKSGLLYGTMVGKLGWQTSDYTRKVYSKNPDGSVKTTKHIRSIAHPVFEYCSLRNVLVNPHTNCQDIRTSRGVVFQKFMFAKDLDDLRKDYKNVPTLSQLKEILANQDEQTRDTISSQANMFWRENQAEAPQNIGSADPLWQPLELLEYWDGCRVITVLQRTIVIRNEEHDLDGHPFRSCCFIDVLNSFYGFGVAKLLAGEQSLQQGVTNKWVDALSLTMDPSWHRKKGSSRSQNIELAPGKVINDDGEMVPLEVKSVTEEAMTAIAASENRANRRVGSNFGPQMPTQAMRTAEGVNAFTSGVQSKLQYFIENVSNMVFIPAVEAFIELVKDNMDPDDIKAILSDRDATAFSEIADVMEIYNGVYDVSVLDSVKVAARRAMVQMLIPIMQMLGQPGIVDSFKSQGKKFNWLNFFEDVGNVIGWPIDNWVDDMTAQDLAMMQAQNPAVIKAQADAQAQAQQHQNDLELTDRKGDVQAGVAVVKGVINRHENMAQAATEAAQVSNESENSAT